MYRGEYLSGYAGSEIVIRYDLETQRAISNQSILNEIRDRHHYIDSLPIPTPIDETPAISSDTSDASTPSTPLKPPKPIPEIRVYDYEQLRRLHGH